jgi:RecA/RadA recombinase
VHLKLLRVGLEMKVDLLQQREIAEVLMQVQTLAVVVVAQVRLEGRPKEQEMEMTAVLELQVPLLA